MRRSLNTNKDSAFKIVGGISLSAIGWPFFANNIDNFATSLQSFLSDKIPASINQCFNSHYIMGCILGSQVFIKGCGNHSPIINFVERGITGLLYYIPAAIAFGLIDNYLGNGTTHYQWLAYKSLSILAGSISGSVVGNLLSGVLLEPLEFIYKNIDSAANVINKCIANLPLIPQEIIGRQ